MKKKTLTIVIITIITVSIISSIMLKSVSADDTNNEEFSLKFKWKYLSESLSRPTFVDINRDGKREVITTESGAIIALNNHGKVIWRADINATSTPVVGDLDNDGHVDMIVNTLYGIARINDEGQIVWLNLTIYTSDTITLADINHDSLLDIVIIGYSNVYALNCTGGIIWNYVLPDDSNNYYINIDIINGDNDPELETIIADKSQIVCVDDDGSIKWTKETNGGVSDLLAFDFNHDGIDELITIDGNSGYVYAIKSSNGDTLWQNATLKPFIYPVIADLDSDGIEDLIVLESPHIYYINGYTGEIRKAVNTGVTFIPENHYYSLIYRRPLIGDFNGDGKMDLLTFGDSPNIRRTALLIISCDGAKESEIDTNSWWYIAEPLINDFNNDSVTDILIYDYSEINCYSFNANHSGPNLWYMGHGNVFNTGRPDDDGDLLGTLEENFYHTNSSNPDTDGDKLTDGGEVLGALSDPTKVDTDGDGMNDLDEFITHLNPRLADLYLDYDNDNIVNIDEINIYHTDPFNNDTDYDFMNDGDEINVYHTDPLNNDTDNDGLLDGNEVYVYGTSPNNNDTDGDEMPDGWEVTYNLNPLNNDSYDDADNDGLLNIEEFQWNCNATNIDTDNDNITDGKEVHVYFTNPITNDTDDDGLTDYNEIFVVHTLPNNNDTDGDGTGDGWEVTYNFNPLVNDSYLDPDNDSLTNKGEFQYNTEPYINDTDHDKILDGIEVHSYSTNPLSNDTDNDGIDDYNELFVYHSNPLNNDTDGDGMPDSYEIEYGLNAIVNDSFSDLDNDNITNIEEYNLGTLPNNNDTDGDGMSDGFEYEYGLYLFENDRMLDPDKDSLTNINEFKYWTSPISNDTDGDGMLDGKEVHYGLNPHLNDSALDADNDTISNIDEVNKYGTDPLSNDTDKDSLTDSNEIFVYKTSPVSDDTDGDDLTDYDEIMVFHTNPLKVDTDGDGLSDYVEIMVFHTNPLKVDTDGDGLSDKEEIAMGNNPLVKNAYTPLAKFMLVLPYLIAAVVVAITITIIILIKRARNLNKQKDQLVNDIELVKSELANIQDRIKIMNNRNTINIFDSNDYRTFVDITKITFNFIGKFDSKYSIIKKYKDVDTSEWDTLSENVINTYGDYLDLVNNTISKMSFQSFAKDKLIDLEPLEQQEELGPEEILKVHSAGKEIIVFSSTKNKLVGIIEKRLGIVSSMKILRRKISEITKNKNTHQIVADKFKELTNLEEIYLNRAKAILHKNYYCIYCGTKIDSITDPCPNCKKPMPRCTVCHEPILQLEEVYTCPSCGNMAHKDHLKEWLGEKGPCPSCGEVLVIKALEMHYS